MDMDQSIQNRGKMKTSSYVFTEKLKQAREAKGWTQEDLAEIFTLETGIRTSHSLVQKWEAGDRVVKLETLLALSKWLGVKVTELAKRVNDEQ